MAAYILQAAAGIYGIAPKATSLLSVWPQGPSFSSRNPVLIPCRKSLLRREDEGIPGQE